MTKKINHENSIIKTSGKRSILLFRYAVTLVAIPVIPAQIYAANWRPLTDTGLGIDHALLGHDAQYHRAKPAFRENGTQTVTDQNSGLIWLKSSEGLQHTWQDATSYCSELVFAGKSDWRLPDKFELESIVDYGKSYPAINQAFDCQRSFYWSATPHAGNPEYAWSVFCKDGADHWVHKSNHYFVRCVRAGR